MRNRVKEEALRLIRMGGVETRGRKSADVKREALTPNAKPCTMWSTEPPPGLIPWKVLTQAYKNVYPRGRPARAERIGRNETDILGPLRAELSREHVLTRATKKIANGNDPYKHLKDGARAAHVKRARFLEVVSECMTELRAEGTPVKTKSVVRRLLQKDIRAGTTTTQRAIREIRLGLTRR